MLNSLRSWLIRLLGGKVADLDLGMSDSSAHTTLRHPVGNSPANLANTPSHESHVVPYDENLLSRARDLWLTGDWCALSGTCDDDLQHHPDRAKLALLTGATYFQLGQATEARKYIKLATNWGCDKKILSQILIAGVHNNIGRAAAAAGMESRALRNFDLSLVSGGVAAATPATVRARVTSQLNQLHINLPLVTQGAVPPEQQLFSDAVLEVVRACLTAPDVHAAVDDCRQNQLPSWSADARFAFYLALSDGLAKERGDRMAALSYLQYARRHTTDWSPGLSAALASRFVSLGYAHLAAEFITEMALLGVAPAGLADNDRLAIEKAHQALHQAVGQKSEHGHDLLLTALTKSIADYKASVAPRQPVLVEVGTTREDIPGQGSTRKVALFCQQHGINFITVDMDPHNSLLAREMFTELGLDAFQAVTMKGEDYLREYQGALDFVFLDAYDFDHGKHSEIRQSRYEKFLGGRIDEAQCHQMHLDCAESVCAKLAPAGLVCVDDTWLENGRWTAKGTLAMPYLLSHGFELVEARNRAALLRRRTSVDEAPSATAVLGVAA